MPNTLTKKEVSRLEAIVRIHHSIGAILDLTAIARILVRELTSMLDCDAAAIMLIEGDKVNILAEKGFSRTFGKMELTTAMPAVKHIVSTRESIFSTDVANTPAANCLPYGYLMGSLICVPIIVNGEVKGIIHLDSTKNDAFNKEDLELTELLAKEISLSLERSLLFARVVDISIKDGLTGCYNRRKFDLDIVADFAYARQNKKPLSMLMVDIDWFKNYNDFHGHPQGDKLLKKLVSILTANVRPSDKIYRYGGEEFAMLLSDTGKVKAAYTATRLREVIEKGVFAGEESQPDKDVTISIGVATFPADAKDWTALIKAADLALYEAKQTGRNKVCAYNQKCA
jgi:diguanylate cyclase (GGDEF)-like protein